jgi:hypothetical protein
MIYGWRKTAACMFVNADKITSDMSMEEARKQVIDYPWPEDSREQVSHAAIAVRSNEHFYLLVKGDKGIFEVGEEYDSVLTEGLTLIKSQIEASPGFDDIATVTDRKRRLEMLKEKLAAPKQLTATKAKKKQSRKKGGGSTGGGKSGGAGGGASGGGGSSGSAGGEQDGGGGKEAKSWAQMARENGWQKVEPKKKVVVVRAQPPAIKQQSALVIYTQATAKDFMHELAHRDQLVAELVVSTRQKEGHVVLMANTEDVQELKDCLPWFREWGIQAKEYRLKDRTLANSAAQGWKDRTREAGVCHHFLKSIDCPFRGHCRFKCYPPEG